MIEKSKRVYSMRMDKYVVKIFWGEEGQVWIAVCDEIPLTLHAETIELLMEDVKETAPEILELNNLPYDNHVLNFQIEEVLSPTI